MALIRFITVVIFIGSCCRGVNAIGLRLTSRTPNSQSDLQKGNEKSSRTLLLLGALRRARPLEALQLIDTRTGNVVVDLKNGTRVDVSRLGTSRPSLTLRAVPGARTRAVQFASTNRSTRVETSEPYIACGNLADGSMRACEYLTPGTTHRVQVTPYSCRTGRCGASRSTLDVTFTIEPVCNVQNDNCPYRNDGECDAGFLCANNTDCVDCGPCSKYAQSCATCTSAPEDCVWCGVDKTCQSPGAVSCPGSTVATCPNTPFVCNVKNDTCRFRNDGECDAGLLCASNTDCVDCGPCSKYARSCAKCTSAPDGCVWCEADKTCQSVGAISCLGSTVATCPTAVPLVCNVRNDTCRYRNDGACDAGTFCANNTDCVDCGPCSKYAQSCATCTGAPEGCLWCGVDQTCQSVGAVSCPGSTVATCPPTTIVPSGCQVENDTCRFRNDGECDAGILCANNTDCVDCGRCSSYAQSCTTCTSAPVDCVWCGVDQTCQSADAVSCPGSTVTTCPIVPFVCNVQNDTCRFRNDGGCDAGTYCASNTDCFDCDPCSKYALTSCVTCTSAPENCVWCGVEGGCTSPGATSCLGSNAVATCSNATFFSDPLFESMMWLYDMINVQDVWKSGVTGKGVGIRINDEGVDSRHPEFSSKFDVNSSCSIYAPNRLDDQHNHGTVCASLAAGSSNAGGCSVGIAPDARVSGCRMLSSRSTNTVTVEAADSSYLYKNMAAMHVSSNSYGFTTCQPKENRRNLQASCPFSLVDVDSPCQTILCRNNDWSNPKPNPSCELAVIAYCRDKFEKDVQACTSFLDLFVRCHYISQSLEEMQAIIEGITNGRGGKGIVYVYSSGNDFDSGADVNFEGTLNNRYIISVGAVGKDKVHASYSTPGAALFVTAPGGDVETMPNNVVALAGGGCIDGGVGTSFATPVVSGVVALMLQVNDMLTWRDIQGIIATTSQKVSPTDPSWTTNAAGLHHSYLYGFGVVDARAAVEAAKTWVSYNAEQQIIAESGPVNVTIAEFQTPSVWTMSTINVSTPLNVTVESVIVYVDLTHSSRGDMDIVLISPQGTSSLLAPGERPENQQLADDERWRLMTVRNWGERANGNWTLQLVDRSRGDLATCVNLPGWSVNITVSTPNLVFRRGNYTLDCSDFLSTRACVGGRQGTSFNIVFAGVATNINDTVLRNTKGISPAQACCECGGGRLASTVPDVLKSWRLALFGH